MIIWPSGTGSASLFVVECKLLRGGRTDTSARGLEQMAAYLSGADAGHLVVFDVWPGRSWADRVFRKTG